MRTKIKAIIVGVNQTTSSHSVSGSTYRQTLVVKEVPEINPYGKDYTKIIPFGVEIHNHNIEVFGVSEKSVGNECTLDLVIYPQLDNKNSFIVNGLIFDL